MAETDQVESASRIKPMRCVICQHVSHGYHFGILSCRACAAFFRRTITENKVYKCRGDMKCSISKEQRNMCRACRFLKCEEKGMNKNDIQFNRDSIGRKVSPPSEKPSYNVEIAYQQVSHGPNYIPVPSSYLTMPKDPINVPENYDPNPLPTLERLNNGCNLYFFGMKSTASSSENDQNSQPSFTAITHTDVCRLEREYIPHIYKIVCEKFMPFDELDKSTKKYVLHQFYSKYHVMECVYQTYRNASILPKNTWFIFDGYLLYENNVGAIVADTPIRSEVLQSVALLIKHTTKMKKSFEQFQVDGFERAAMAGILLWQEVSNMAPLWSEATNARTTILNELHTHVLNKCGIAKAGSRIGALMCILNEVETVSRIFLERETMEKIFDSRYTDAWDSLVM